MTSACSMSVAVMSDRTDSIHALQRAARSEGRSDLRRTPEPRTTRRLLSTDGVRRATAVLRDGAHYHGLRLVELFGALPQRTRRVAAGSGAATMLLIVVLTATAGADDEGRQAATRTADPAAPAVAAQGTSADETLFGTPGPDRINGRAGDDVIFAGDGDDILSGATGNDVLHGGEGNDTLFAGPGRDVLFGGPGNDVLRATNLDGTQDRLHCGPGNDVAWVVARDGRIEDITTGCERVNVIDVRATRRLR